MIHLDRISSQILAYVKADHVAHAVNLVPKLCVLAPRVLASRQNSQGEQCNDDSLHEVTFLRKNVTCLV